MNGRLFRALAVAALVLIGAAAIAIGAYNAGMANGIAESGRMIAAAPAAGTPYVYVWPRPWGFGYFPFFPVLFLLFFFFAVRGLLWRSAFALRASARHGFGETSSPPHGSGGCRYDGVPPMFEEWHRRAHAGRPDPGSRTPDPGSVSSSGV
jgi:hypothetical protein